MPTNLKLEGYDALYDRLATDKVLINDVDIFNAQTKEVIDSIIMRNYSEDNLSIIPSCQCGDLKGAYYVGDVCRVCNTRVVNSLDDPISFLVWVRKPQEVERFISPIVLAVLVNRYKMTKPNVPLISYILLPNFKIDRKQQKLNIHILERLEYLLEQNNIPRGYNSFIQNFFRIIEILETEFYKKKTPGEPDFLEFLQSNKDNIFSNNLPFPNKMIFATESNELGRFIDKSLLQPINVIRRLTGIDLYTKPSSVKQLKVAKSLLDLAEFNTQYLKKVIFGKPGLIRQEISSARSHLTARAVIVSIAGIHNHDELHLCWSGACSLLRPFILNRLYSRGFSYKDASNFLLYHNQIYNPILDEIFKEIVAASGTGLLAFFSRNPSLHRGSIQLVRITKIKTDPMDKTFSMSDRIGPSFNSDHDGDEMNLYLITTDPVARNAHYMRPMHNILGLTGPNEFSNNIKFPKTLISTLANWMNESVG